LPPDLENGPAQSQYLGSQEFQSHGPARVILGGHGSASSKVAAPETMTYLDVRLNAGERWRYEPPHNHAVAWIAVHEGSVKTPSMVTSGELAVFEDSSGAIEFEAQDGVAFILGSAIKHPHDLVLGYYSVHTNPNALKRGEANIARIGRQLKRRGSFPDAHRPFATWISMEEAYYARQHQISAVGWPGYHRRHFRYEWLE
jgi:hypothetical protein